MFEILKKLFSPNEKESAEVSFSCSGEIDNTIPWERSEIHLMILEHFMKPKVTEKGAPSLWRLALGDELKKALDSLWKRGALLPIDLKERINLCNNVSGLKKILKEKNLIVSGKKHELIDRLVEADPKGMAERFPDNCVLVCSTQAEENVLKYQVKKKEEWDNLVIELIASLRNGNFEKASQLIDNYEKKQITIEHENCMTIPKPPRETSTDIKELKTIFSMRPKILKELPEKDWKPLCVVAAMNHLFHYRTRDEWFPPNFTGVTKFHNHIACMMMEHHFRYIKDIDRMRNSGVTRGSIASSCRCEDCKKISGVIRELDDLPELPYENCTCSGGCICFIMPEIPRYGD